MNGSLMLISENAWIMSEAFESAGSSKGWCCRIICNNSTDWAICFFANSGLVRGLSPCTKPNWRRFGIHYQWRYIKVLFISKKEIYAKIKMSFLHTTLQKVIVMEGMAGYAGGTGKERRSQEVKAYIRINLRSVYWFILRNYGRSEGVLLSQANITSNAHAVMVCFLNWMKTIVHYPSCLGSCFRTWRTCWYCILADQWVCGKRSDYRRWFSLLNDIHDCRSRVFNKVYDGLWTKMNEEGGLAKTLFVMEWKRQEKTGTAAQGKSCFKTNLKFKIADAIVFKKSWKTWRQIEGVMTGSPWWIRKFLIFLDMVSALYAYGLTETSPVQPWTVDEIQDRQRGSRMGLGNRDRQSVVGPDAKDGRS